MDERKFENIRIPHTLEFPLINSLYKKTFFSLHIKYFYFL